MKVKVMKRKLSAAEAARVDSCREYMPKPEQRIFPWKSACRSF